MERGYLKKWFSVFLFLLISAVVFGQSNPNPCGGASAKCDNSGVRNGIVFSFGDTAYQYPAPGTSMPFWIAVGDTNNNTIDTTFSGPVVARLISGPGNLMGTMSYNFSKYQYFNDFIFLKDGLHEVEFSVAGIYKDTVQFSVLAEVDLCNEIPAGCKSGGGTHVYPLAANGGVIPVDAIFPITIAVYDPTTGIIDSSFFNYGYVDQISGPGNMYGTLSMYGQGWLLFPDIRFDAIGTYKVKLRADGGYVPDTVTIQVVPTVGVEALSVDDKIYPNPVVDKLFIDSYLMERFNSFRVYDTSGRLQVGVSHFKSNYIDLSTLMSGSYIIVFQNTATHNTGRSIFIKN